MRLSSFNLLSVKKKQLLHKQQCNKAVSVIKSGEVIKRVVPLHWTYLELYVVHYVGIYFLFAIHFGLIDFCF